VLHLGLQEVIRPSAHFCHAPLRQERPCNPLKKSHPQALPASLCPFAEQRAPKILR
jgi:hypothetical protein